MGATGTGAITLFSSMMRKNNPRYLQNHFFMGITDLVVYFKNPV